MTFDSLDVSDGGVFDVFDETTKYVHDDSVTLAIGLGNAGTRALRSLKREMFLRFRSPEPFDRTRFLAVTADWFMQGGASSPMALREYDTDHLEGSEYSDIGISMHFPEWFRENRARYERDPRFRDWLDFDDMETRLDGLSYESTDGSRRMGRFLMILAAEGFVRHVRRVIASAMRGLDSSTPIRVMVIANLDEGTGSGALMDACYVVRKALELYPRVESHGFLLVHESDVRHLHEVGERRADAERTLWEMLDRMRDDGRRTAWRQVYSEDGSLVVDTTMPPFDRCHLVVRSGVDDWNWVLRPYASYDRLADRLIDMLIRDDDGGGSDAGADGPAVDVMTVAGAMMPYSMMLADLLERPVAMLDDLSEGKGMPAEEYRRFQKTIGIDPDYCPDREATVIHLGELGDLVLPEVRLPGDADMFLGTVGELSRTFEEYRKNVREWSEVRGKRGTPDPTWPYDAARRIVAGTPVDDAAVAHDLLWALARGEGDDAEGPSIDELTVYRRFCRFARDRFPGIVGLAMTDLLACDGRESRSAEDAADDLLHGLMERATVDVAEDSGSGDGCGVGSEARWRTVVTLPAGDPTLAEAARRFAATMPDVTVRVDSMPDRLRVTRSMPVIV
ncbi:tubulin-like doman-containing protein [Bifidobacterium parmae]|uniref:Tubulin like n=1 Tax=Bifidobacterium parmae TaxID=361854 RepID=A0A2N5IVV1_9BIFI|nr:tubulin-like doman-containing protein [Bifidobacterium parmae]PLS26078.1 Tubulin like [Bifidobacterium parmae]